MLAIIKKSFLIGVLACTSLGAQAEDWDLAKDDSKNGIKVFTRVVEGSPLKEFRGIAQVPASLTGAVALVNDHSAGADWIHDCKVLETIDRPNAYESNFYMVTKAPWPVKDRDSTIHSLLTQDSDTLKVRIEMNLTEGVREEHKKRVRVSQMQGYWLFTPIDENTTEITYQVHADPSGSLPNWLVNSLVVDMPYNTLKNMQDKVLEDKYQNAELDTVVNL